MLICKDRLVESYTKNCEESPRRFHSEDIDNNSYVLEIGKHISAVRMLKNTCRSVPTDLRPAVVQRSFRAVW